MYFTKFGAIFCLTVVSINAFYFAEIPEPPLLEDMICVNNTATIYWNIPDMTTKNVTDVLIQYTTPKLKGRWISLKQSVNSSITHIKITLRQNEKYTFKIRSKNLLGTSDPSTTSKACKTSELHNQPDPHNELPTNVETEDTVDIDDIEDEADTEKSNKKKEKPLKRPTRVSCGKLTVTWQKMLRSKPAPLAI